MALDAQARLLGRPWRGNLRVAINEAGDTAQFLTKLFGLCRVERKPEDCRVTIAIDAPLAFPASLIALLTAGRIEPAIGDSATNPYLYRFTERRLATSRVPLSVVKDMIGSQSTKAIHAVNKFAPVVEALGVWCDGGATRLIETYPAECLRRSGEVDEFHLDGVEGHKDIVDAGVCALIAHRFSTAPETVEQPPYDAPASEGWIWLPINKLRVT